MSIYLKQQSITIIVYNNKLTLNRKSEIFVDPIVKW